MKGCPSAHARITNKLEHTQLRFLLLSMGNRLNRLRTLRTVLYTHVHTVDRIDRIVPTRPYPGITTTDPHSHTHQLRLLKAIKVYVDEKLGAIIRFSAENVWASLRCPVAAKGVPRCTQKSRVLFSTLQLLVSLEVTECEWADAMPPLTATYIQQPDSPNLAPLKFAKVGEVGKSVDK